MRETTTATTWWWTGGGSGEEKKLRGKIYRKWRRKNTTNEGRGREQRTEGIESTLRCRRSKSSGTRRVRGRQRITATAKAVSEYAFSVARAGRETHPSQAGRLALDDWTRLAVRGVPGGGVRPRGRFLPARSRQRMRTRGGGESRLGSSQPARHGHGWMGTRAGRVHSTAPPARPQRPMPGTYGPMALPARGSQRLGVQLQSSLALLFSGPATLLPDCRGWPHAGPCTLCLSSMDCARARN